MLDLPTLTHFFMWCTIIHGGLLALWTLSFMFMPELVYRSQQRFFPIKRETHTVVMYCFLGLFKIMFLIFVFVPYLALLIVA